MSFDNPQSSYQLLTHLVNQITKQYRCSMSADLVAKVSKPIGWIIYFQQCFLLS